MTRNNKLYMWVCFGVSAAIILVVWSFVFTKSLSSFAPEVRAKNPELEKTFKEFEATLEGFRTVHQDYFKSRGAEARAELDRDIALQKLKEKLESATSTNH